MAGVDYPGTYQELLSWFPDNAACLRYLADLRWQQGFSCPACGSTEYWRTRAGLWMCRSCNRKTSVTAGTIFDRTRTPLSTWFAAIWFVTAQRNGVSARNLQRILGFGSYETAWAWLHKIRRAMVRPDRDRLAGTVEADETFVGGVNHGLFGGYGDKVCVCIAVETLTRNKLGRVRLCALDQAGYDDIVEFITTSVEPGATVRTDGHGAYLRLKPLGYEHHIAALTGKQPRSAQTELPPSTASPHCSNAGFSAPITSATAPATSPITSTNSPSDSTDAHPAIQECSSTDYSNKQSPPTHTHSATSSPKNQTKPTSPKQIRSTSVLYC